MRLKVLILLLIIGASLCLMGASLPEVYFQSEDPVGDEHGYGTYQYPGNIAFEPYEGLFDITGFKVWKDKAGEINFDTSFVKITNPWMAPEGFIHQNIRIFIDTTPGKGYNKLPKRGAYVEFASKYAWDICLKIVGWGNSQFLIYENGILKARPLATEVLGDNLTIRAKVPESLIGTPEKSWNYYVLVGSYDGFGEDFFRKVMKDSGQWVIGGGFNENIEPQVMDILAPKSGPHSQKNQLKSFDPESGKLALLYPVGQSKNTGTVILMTLKILGIMALLGGLGYLIYKKPQRISWFWVKNQKSESNSHN